MEAHTQTREDLIRSACHTAVSELEPGTSASDLLDCVVGQVPEEVYDEVNFEPFALYWLNQYATGLDLTEWCESHEPTNGMGPAGVSVYCDGTCYIRRNL